MSQIKPHTPAFGQYFAQNPKTSITVRTFFTVVECSRLFNYDFRILPPQNNNKQDWHQSKVVNTIQPNLPFTKKIEIYRTSKLSYYNFI